MDDLEESTRHAPFVTREKGKFAFICYSHRDSDRVYEDLSYLNQQEIPLWFDEGISPGIDWSTELADAIDSCALCIFFASKDSIESRHCRNECVFALGHDIPILTVYLDDVALPSGLQLTLGSTQAVHRYRHTLEDYNAILMEVLQKALDEGIFDGLPSEHKSTFSKKKSNPLTKVGQTIGFVLVALVLLFLTFQEDILPTPPQNPVPGLAVLPFTGDIQSTAIGNQITTSLASVASVKVATRNDVSAYIGEEPTKQSSEAIGAALNVNYLLDGDLISSADGYEFTIYLTDVTAGYNIWTGQYKLKPEHLDHLPPNVGLHITESIRIHTHTASLEEMQELGTSSQEAFRAYKLGRHLHMTWNPSEISKALEYYETAIDLDPDFYRAYRGIATALADSRFSLPSEESIDVARSMIKKIGALDLKDPKDSRFYDLFILYLVDWDLKKLDQLLQEGMKTGKLSSQLYGIYGFWVLRPSGLIKESTEFINYAYDRSIDLGGYERASALLWRAHTFSAMGDWVQSDRSLESCYNIDSRNLLCRSLGFLNAIQSGNIERAQELWKVTRDLSDSKAFEATGDMFLAASTGDISEAVRLLTFLESDPNAIPFYIGWMHMQLGNLDEGFKWWEIAYAAKDPNLLHNLYAGNLLVPPHVKTDKRYLALKEAIGLTPEWTAALRTRLPELPHE